MPTRHALQPPVLPASHKHPKADGHFEAPGRSGIIDDTLDALSDTVRDIRDEVGHTLNHTGAIAHHGANAVCEGSRHLRDKARDTANSAIDGIRDKPVKAALMAWPRTPTIAGIAFLWGRLRHGRWSKVRWGVGNHST